MRRILLLSLAGRFFDGDPDNDRDNIVIVGYAAVRGMEAFHVVREWCYPAVREAQADAMAGTDQVSMRSREPTWRHVTPYRTPWSGPLR